MSSTDATFKVTPLPLGEGGPATNLAACDAETYRQTPLDATVAWDNTSDSNPQTDVTVDRLMPGNYIVQETTPPPGYNFDASQTDSCPNTLLTPGAGPCQEVTVCPEAAVGSPDQPNCPTSTPVPWVATFDQTTNCAIPGVLKIVKVGDDVPFLETGGATFTVKGVGLPPTTATACDAESYTQIPSGGCLKPSPGTQAKTMRPRASRASCPVSTR